MSPLSITRWLVLTTLAGLVAMSAFAAPPVLQVSPMVEGYVYEHAASPDGPWTELHRLPVPVPAWTAPAGTGPYYRVRSYAGQEVSPEATLALFPLQPPPVVTGTVPDGATAPGPPVLPPGPYPLLPQTQLRGVSASSELPGATAAKAVDGLLTTHWRTANNDTLPHMLVLDTGAVQALDGLQMTPRPDTRFGDILTYTLAVSTDQQQWQDVAEGVWEASATPKAVRWAAVQGRYVRLLAKSNTGFTGVAEVGITGVPLYAPIAQTP